jgi:hypothetical protein
LQFVENISHLERRIANSSGKGTSGKRAFAMTSLVMNWQIMTASGLEGGCMGWEMRRAINKLMKDLGVTQTELREKLEKKHEYRVSKSDMSSYLSGKLNTPKAKRVLKDSLEILLKEQNRIEDMLAQVNR